MLLIFQYVKSDEAVRIVARTGRKRLHKIGTAKRIPTIREPEKASDSCEDNANTKSGEAPDLPTKNKQVYLDLGASIPLQTNPKSVYA